MFEKLTEAINKDRKRAYMIAGVGVLLLILIFVQASAPARRRGQLRDAVGNLVTTNTMHVKSEIELNLPTQLRNQQRPIIGVTAKVEGDVDNSGERPNLTGNLFLEARGRGMVLFADGDLRILQDKVLFNLDNLPTLLNPKGNLVEKWTETEVALFQTNNPDDVRNALASFIASATHEGKDVIPGTSIKGEKFTRSFTPEEEDVLIEAFRQGRSGNRALHIITRLLRAFDVRTFEVWVDGDEVRRIYAEFDKENDTEPRGKLTLEFSDYGKTVVIDEPESEITVDSSVFARIFGRGEIEEIGN